MDMPNSEARVWVGEHEAPARAFALAYRGGSGTAEAKSPSRLRRLLKAAAEGVLSQAEVEVRKGRPGDLLATVRCKQGHLALTRTPAEAGTLIAHALSDPNRLIQATEGIFLRLSPEHVALGAVGGSASPWTPYMSEGALFVRTIHERTTPYQHISVAEHPVYGRLLFLNGETQIGERDEPRYSASLVAAAIRKRTKRVAILGGGDCGVLREVLTHPVEEVVMVEIDEEVVEVAAEYFPATVGDARTDPRATIVFTDALTYLERRAAEGRPPFDLIIYDLSDDPLALASFDKLCERVHTCLAQKGRIAVQCGSGLPMYAANLKKHLRGLRRHFRKLTTQQAVIDSFLQQPWVFAFARRRAED